MKSATFNAYHGVKEAIRNDAIYDFQTKIIHPNNIVNYRNKEDFWTNRAYNNDIGLSLGTDAQIKRKAGLLEKYHISENMGKLDNTRVKNQDYSHYITTQNGLISPMFLGKMRNFMHDKLNP